MTAPRFAIGSEVSVISLGRKAGVVIGIASDGRYRVRVGNLSMICRGDDLAEISVTRASKRQRQTPLDPTPGTVVNAGVTGAIRRIDLHGMTVEEAVGAVLKALDAAIRDGADRLEIVHGRGTGRLKAAVQRELARIAVVRAVKADPHNPGVTWAYL